MEETQAKMEAGAVPMRFEDVYLAYYKGIYNYIFGCLRHRESAEDVTADVFAAVHRNFSRLDTSRGTLSAWIFTIARNAMRDFRKRAVFRREVLGDVPEMLAMEMPFLENGGKDDTLHNPDNVWLAQLLRQLSEEEVDFLMMRYQMNLSNGEIAEALAINESAVSKRYRRLLDKLRELDKKMRDGSRCPRGET